MNHTAPTLTSDAIPVQALGVPIFLKTRVDVYTETTQTPHEDAKVQIAYIRLMCREAKKHRYLLRRQPSNALLCLDTN
jgi:hypothetical protein